MTTTPPIVLTINGSDCSGGCGLQADLKTFTRFGVHGLTAVTSVMVETPLKVVDLQGVAAKLVKEQVRLMLDAFPVKAIKTGVMHSGEQVRVVADALSNCSVPLVVDADMLTTTRESLLSQDAVETYKKHLFPAAVLMTPNLDEARYLLGGEGRRVDEPGDVCAKLLHDEYGCAVIVTGTHDEQRKLVVDFLVQDGKVTQFENPWVEIPYAHGTGCTFTAAITAGLARGHDLVSAVTVAEQFIAEAISTSHQWDSPGGVLTVVNHLSGEVFGSPEEREC